MVEKAIARQVVVQTDDVGRTAGARAKNRARRHARPASTRNAHSGCRSSTRPVSRSQVSQRRWFSNCDLARGRLACRTCGRNPRSGRARAAGRDVADRAHREHDAARLVEQRADEAAIVRACGYQWP